MEEFLRKSYKDGLITYKELVRFIDCRRKNLRESGRACRLWRSSSSRFHNS